MKLFKVIIIISIAILLSACGRNGARTPYPGYPKTYPAPSPEMPPTNNNKSRNSNQQDN